MSKITVEIERKFSIKDAKSLPEGPEYSIKQWYLPKKAYSFDGRNLTISNCIVVSAESKSLSDAISKALSRKRPTVRIRIIDGNTAWLTIKGKTKNYSCIELEWPIDIDEAKATVESNGWPNVEKIRRYIDTDGLTWEVDRFLGDNEGLWLAEIEIPSIDTKFKTPSWVNREVSHISELSSHKLAKKPFTTWGKGLISRALYD